MTIMRILKFNQYINEEFSRAPLYHAIKFDRAEKALERNKLDCYSFQRIWPEGKRLKDDQPGYYDSQYLRGISLTRDFEYAKSWNDVVFEFNQEKLKQKWRIVPYNWGYSIGGEYKQGSRMKREREEFLITGVTDKLDINQPVGSIKHLDRYLTGFWIDSFLTTLNGYDGIEKLMEHPLFCGFFNRERKKFFNK
jgi:hypothetical protein